MTQQNVTFRVSDMTCNHCAGTIRSALETKLPGAAVEIDVANARVTVHGDESIAESAIRGAGYTPERVAN